MATYREATGKTIDEAFSEFDRENPRIYLRFCELVDKLRAAGVTRTSSKLIINRIRWDLTIETKSEDGFKINDAFTSRYARKYIQQYPEHEGLFEIRQLRSNGYRVSGPSEPMEVDINGQGLLHI